MKIKIQEINVRRIDYRQLKPIQGNLKDLSEVNYKRLKKSFEEKGLFVPLFVWEHEGQFKLLDGHGREKLFQKEGAVFVDEKGIETHDVPCLIVQADSLQDAKEKILIISSQYQSITQDGFKLFTQDLNFDWVASATNFDAFGDLAQKLKPKINLKDPEEIPPETKEPKTKRGQIYRLGDHRLMCGSSTNKNDVDRLTKGVDHFSVCLTDPPYSVEYEQSDSDRRKAGFGSKNKRVYSHYRENDSAKDLLTFIDHMKSDVLIFSYPVNKHFFDLAEAFKRNDLYFFKEIIWAKDKFAFGAGSIYQAKHEPIIFAVKNNLLEQVEEALGMNYKEGHDTVLIALRNGKKIRKESKVPSNETTVWEYPKPAKHDLHPTVKPVAMWSKLVSYHVPDGSVFYEPFCGSGTSIIAAEMNGVTCYAMELSEFFCDTIIERWQNYTGKKAELIE